MCGQGSGKYSMEKLYVNGASFLAERKDDGLHIPDDMQCIAKAKLELGLSFSVETSIESWAQNNGTWDTISYWLDEYGNRINVYNPDMKDSPVKVVREHNFISIYIFYDLVGDMPDSIDGIPTGELVETAFSAWGAGGYLFPNNNTSEKFGNYTGVKVNVHYIYSAKASSLKIIFNA